MNEKIVGSYAVFSISPKKPKTLTPKHISCSCQFSNEKWFKVWQFSSPDSLSSMVNHPDTTERTHGHFKNIVDFHTETKRLKFI
jgi:hypothetical protein